mmetsp:Transcript_67/g.105  ORF Transcript_67/g.105 Transcript_67/m.105 type:complete len:326 (-) Transcript_67:453-1430(-)
MRYMSGKYGSEPIGPPPGCVAARLRQSEPKLLSALLRAAGFTGSGASVCSEGSPLSSPGEGLHPVCCCCWSMRPGVDRQARYDDSTPLLPYRGALAIPGVSACGQNSSGMPSSGSRCTGESGALHMRGSIAMSMSSSMSRSELLTCCRCCLPPGCCSGRCRFFFSLQYRISHCLQRGPRPVRFLVSLVNSAAALMVRQRVHCFLSTVGCSTRGVGISLSLCLQHALHQESSPEVCAGCRLYSAAGLTVLQRLHIFSVTTGPDIASLRAWCCCLRHALQRASRPVDRRESRRNSAAGLTSLQMEHCRSVTEGMVLAPMDFLSKCSR